VKVELTIWQWWALRTLSYAGGSSQTLEGLAAARIRIERETEASLDLLGLEWYGSTGLRAKDGQDPSMRMEGLAACDMAPPEIYALFTACHGDQGRGRYIWPQGLPARAIEVAVSIGAVLNELVEDAAGWEAYEKLPDKVKRGLRKKKEAEDNAKA